VAKLELERGGERRHGPPATAGCTQAKCARQRDQNRTRWLKRQPTTRWCVRAEFSRDRCYSMSSGCIWKSEDDWALRCPATRPRGARARCRCRHDVRVSIGLVLPHRPVPFSDCVKIFASARNASRFPRGCEVVWDGLAWSHASPRASSVWSRRVQRRDVQLSGGGSQPGGGRQD